jgi:Fur family ferric uptake transcriptional regulator
MGRNQKQFIELLKYKNLRVTQPRLSVLGIISDSPVAVSQPELERLLGKEVDRVTLYRCLSVFEEKGIVHKVFDLNGTAAFAMCDASCTDHQHTDQHVHFICSKCNQVYCLDDIKLPPLHLPQSYQLDQIGVNAIGVCAACNK